MSLVGLAATVASARDHTLSQHALLPYARRAILVVTLCNAHMDAQA
jgi:hypothetical protein